MYCSGLMIKSSGQEDQCQLSTDRQDVLHQVFKSGGRTTLRSHQVELKTNYLYSIVVRQDLITEFNNIRNLLQFI